MTELIPARRFDRFFEQLLFSRVFSIVIGWFLCVALPYVLMWGPAAVRFPDDGQITAAVVTSIALVLSNIAVFRLLTRYPGGRNAALVAPQVLAIYLTLSLIVLLFRLDVSRYLLFASGLVALFWLHIEFMALQHLKKIKLAVINMGRAAELANIGFINTRILKAPDLEEIRYDGVVADFDAIDGTWERFLTRCVLKGIAVYNAKHLLESLTGRVSIRKMSENDIGSLLPSRNYERLKFLFDMIIVVLTLPIVLIICAITALCIRLEGPGPILYSQTRIGRGNRPFTLYKFRSMACSKDDAEAFARQDDSRITRVGRVIRMLRIDELPQYINVIRGEMSLIGPRPEQPSFVEEFDELIPFYSYRHVLKPGITGWAQVRSGYASDLDETQIKIEHDFYYIKNASFALDIYIIFLTVKTVFTGYGAR
ncbi:sugar transferase [Advenella kashmirensis]|uniref:sugar transferase n=1 Tax=Advenella kashmirensis TaxID=310575 RepID=UPI0003F9C37C|nr:sugar transferase [Advenella kashmirensis]